MAANDDYLIDTLMDMGAVDVTQVEAARPAAEAANAGLVDTLVIQKVLNPARIVQASRYRMRVDSLFGILAARASCTSSAR